MIRDRKMYVAPTPFGLLSGVAHAETLILPADVDAGRDMECVGSLLRAEASHIVVGYSFDLKTNTIIPQSIPNPSMGCTHSFRAWRIAESSGDKVALSAERTGAQVEEVEDADEQEE